MAANMYRVGGEYYCWS